MNTIKIDWVAAWVLGLSLGFSGAVLPSLGSAGLSCAAASEERAIPEADELIPKRASDDGKMLAIGFYVTWDERSFTSLEAALPQLDWVVPSWLEIAGPEMELKIGVDEKSAELLAANKGRTMVLPMLQNASEGKWDGAGLARLLANPDKRQARLNALVKFLQDMSAQGLVVDFELVPKNAHQNLLTFLLEMRAAFKPHGWVVAIAAPFDDPAWPYKRYAEATDYQILMAYDEHYEEGGPGPIASQPWFVDKLKRRMQQLDARKTIIAIGNYGYDWCAKSPTTDLTFEETILRSKAMNAQIVRDEHTANPHFDYEDEQRLSHHVWFLDAGTARNQISAANEFRPKGYALWRLGSEDPSIWAIFGSLSQSDNSEGTARSNSGK